MNKLGWSRGLLLVLASAVAARGDTLDDVNRRGTLVWGADAEGGGPYVFPDPADPRRFQGFEVELAELLARSLGVKAEFRQTAWTELPSVLATGGIDLVLNGYELTAARSAQMLPTAPYFIYELALLARRDDAALRSWDDLGRPAAGAKRRVGVLTMSGAHEYLQRRFGGRVELVPYEGNTDAMREVELGKCDATVADTPVAAYYGRRFAGLRQVGPTAGRGYYVMYVRRGDDRLRAALDGALARLVADGSLRKLYQRYGIWSSAQEELAAAARQAALGAGLQASELRGWKVVRERGTLLLEAALLTVLLAVASMPLAIVAGLLAALGRLYGPAPLRWLLVGYVELLRGTPLLLQLWFLYFLLPEFGLRIGPIQAGILGLAINYSAYEAEIYRAGLLAVPRGQMEAALSLGMSRPLALRRIIVPQAVRIVVPAVTNDFIALFKDTSVCSVISIVELTKQYSIQRNDTGATVELAALTALLYLLMSVPLSHLAARLEKRFRGAGRPTVA